MKNTTFIIITSLLVCIIGFCVAITVEGQESGQNTELEAYYREMEEKLLDDTKSYLTKLGFSNSGVTLNRIIDAEGKREYTFTIHHSRIDKMDDAARHNLTTQLSNREVSVFDENTSVKCIIYYEYLIL